MELFICSHSSLGGIFNFTNEQITYTHDSTLDGSPVKVLSHRYYYSQCYNAGSSQIKQTCLKQKGDTVFFRNARTNHAWQILYNYASPKGGGWNTSLLKADNTTFSIGITIDSIGQIVKNSYALKRLYIPGGNITERFGNAKFLFDFPSYAAGCDGYYFAEFLCYSDSAFRQVTFTDRSCHFSGQIDINSVDELYNDGATVFFDPASEAIFVNTNGGNIEKVTVWTLTGIQVKEERVMSANARISLAGLPLGVYVADLQTRNRLIRRKIIMTH